MRGIQSPARERLQDVLLQSVHLKPSQSSLLLSELERFLALKAAAQDWRAEILSPSGASLHRGASEPCAGFYCCEVPLCTRP